MPRGGRITVLIIPQQGSKTFELKIPHVLVGLLILLGMVVVMLLGFGVFAYSRSRTLTHRVERLEREKDLLVHEVEQIEELEQILRRLQRSNRQLHAILGESVGLESSPEPFRPLIRQGVYISSLERLQWGRIRNLPTLWPVRGGVRRGFSAEFPGVVLAVPHRSLVRASGAGKVVQARFDARMGYLVVVDHANGIISQYGYNAMLLVEAGDYVQKGQPLALSGSTGAARSPGLFYGVLEDGQPQDPRLYRFWL